MSVDAMIREFDRTFAAFIDCRALGCHRPRRRRSAYRRRQARNEVAVCGAMLVLDTQISTSVGLLAVLMKLFLSQAPEWVGFAVNPGRCGFGRTGHSAGRDRRLRRHRSGIAEIHRLEIGRRRCRLAEIVESTRRSALAGAVPKDQCYGEKYGCRYSTNSNSEHTICGTIRPGSSSPADDAGIGKSSAGAGLP